MLFHVLKLILTFSKWLSEVVNLTHMSHIEKPVLQTFMFSITSLVQLFTISCQAFPWNISFWDLNQSLQNSELQYLPISDLVHTIQSCAIYILPFLTKCNLLAMCLVFLVPLPFLAVHTADFLSKIIRGASYGTISGSLFKKLWIHILICAKAIPAVHSALYLLSALDW